MYTQAFLVYSEKIWKKSLWNGNEVTLTLFNLAAVLFHLISLLEMHGKLRFSPEAIEKWNENDETKKLKQK